MPRARKPGGRQRLARNFDVATVDLVPMPTVHELGGMQPKAPHPGVRSHIFATTIARLGRAVVTVGRSSDDRPSGVGQGSTIGSSPEMYGTSSRVGTAEDPSERMPDALRVARGIMYFQGVANLLTLLMQVIDMADRLQHGQDVTSISYLLAVVSTLFAVLLLACASLLTRRRASILKLAVTTEVAAALIGLTLLFGFGVLLAIVTVLIQIVAIAMLLSADARRWITRRVDGHGGVG